MPLFAANLTMLLTELPFLDRFAAASEAGFEAVEFLFPNLEAFKFDFLKIDRSFLSKITAPGDQQPILEATVALAKALGLPITAEGVGTSIQLDYIQRPGCEYAQGYLFAKPLPEHDLLAHLRRGPCHTGFASGLHGPTDIDNRAGVVA